MQYNFPVEAYEVLADAFGSRDKATKVAKAIEEIVEYSKTKAKEEIIEKKELIKIELKEELKNELVTRELFEERLNTLEQKFEGRFKAIDERFKSIDERFKSIDERFNTLNFKLNIFIAIALIALTFANPTFVELVKNIFK